MNIAEALILRGVWEFWHYRRDLLGQHRLIDRWRTPPNLIVDEGKNHILNVYFAGVSQINPWYVGLFEGNYTPVAGDTGATFPTVSTECTAYDEVSRPEFEEATSTAKSITNDANRAIFTFNATKTLYGGFLISQASKGANGGFLFAAKQFAAPRAVIATDILQVAYTVNAP